MFNNVALDVVIGLVFIFLLYSLLVTIIQEIVANTLSFRAKFLQKGIIRMLEDEITVSKRSVLERMSMKINSQKKSERQLNDFSGFFYRHPLIRYLGENSTRSRPAYLVNSSFSKVMIDLLRGDNVTPGEEIRSRIQKTLESGIIKTDQFGNKLRKNQENTFKIKPQTLAYINSLWVDAQGDVERFRELLENWFDETMERVTGWFRKYIRLVSMIIGFSIAIVFNVDTVAIVHKLEKDPKLREQLVQQADAYLKAHPNLGEELKREKEKKEQEILEEVGKNKFDIAKKDSVLNAAFKDSEERYELLQKKGNTLLQQADSLVQEDIKKTNDLLGLGVGSFEYEDAGSFIKSLLGWFLTALALSLGAPFWFDLLNKLMKLRTSSSAPPAGEKDKKEEARLAKIKRVG